MDGYNKDLNSILKKPFCLIYFVEWLWSHAHPILYAIMKYLIKNRRLSGSLNILGVIGHPIMYISGLSLLNWYNISISSYLRDWESISTLPCPFPFIQANESFFLLRDANDNSWYNESLTGCTHCTIELCLH